MTLPGSPKDVNINVILNSETPKDFRIEPDPPGSLPTGPGGELIFQNDGHSGFFVYFHLVDVNNLGYKFPEVKKDINEAVWSELVADACPATGVWDVFHPRSVTGKGLILKVRNTNVNPEIGKFSYVLRVTKDGGKTYLPLDPGGDNQNGPISRSNWNVALVFVGGAVAGSLATLAGQALING